MVRLKATLNGLHVYLLQEVLTPESYLHRLKHGRPDSQPVCVFLKRADRDNKSALRHQLTLSRRGRVGVIAVELLVHT